MSLLTRGRGEDAWLGVGNLSFCSSEELLIGTAVSSASAGRPLVVDASPASIPWQPKNVLSGQCIPKTICVLGWVALNDFQLMTMKQIAFSGSTVRWGHRNNVSMYQGFITLGGRVQLSCPSSDLFCVGENERYCEIRQ